MKIAGIIAEYNPFHSGHEFHIQSTRRGTECDYVVAVMGGAFTQRGEPALLDKYARAACALRAGVDAVFELPCAYAVRPAAFFARGGVETLNALGVDVLSFGCETDDLDALIRYARLLSCEPPALKSGIRAGLGAGKTLARARGEALSALTGQEPAFFDRPNVALALEYLKSLLALGSSMQPFVVRRTAPYHGGEDDWASASTLRRAVYAGKAEAALLHLPDGARRISASALAEGIPDPRRLSDFALLTLRNLPLSRASALPDGGEGLAERLLSAARGATSYEDLVDKVKCKRYTRARITRLIAAALLDLPAQPPQRIPYLRLTGFREAARPLISELARRAALPIASDAVALRNNPVFALERRATDLWGLLTDSPRYRLAERDLREKFLVIADEPAQSAKND